MTKHPYATLRPGQLVRLRIRRNPNSRQAQRLFWTRNLYVVVSADQVKQGLQEMGIFAVHIDVLLNAITQNKAMI